MARILERLPIINLWKWADGSKYTIDDDATLTPELAESDKETDEAYDKRFRQELKKGNGGEGRFKFKVEKDQLSTEKVSIQKAQNVKGIDGR